MLFWLDSRSHCWHDDLLSAMSTKLDESKPLKVISVISSDFVDRVFSLADLRSLGAETKGCVCHWWFGGHSLHPCSQNRRRKEKETGSCPTCAVESHNQSPAGNTKRNPAQESAIVPVFVCTSFASRFHHGFPRRDTLASAQSLS